ncbi:UDP-N-acetylglucosamine--undecaprenyl-phosphate N-acetylglucosaminephosphotransferase [Motilimonas cestriensis]|uniref:UDP-N-acetylglucosamine--undecaprenyl-phosphate N-acetylglucosaminephosphotransferase n=1 Tax=Motilimonas cestriensis TaxID=2742685 RepID=UPI003DA47B21
MLTLSINLTLVFFFTLLALQFFKPIAERVGLVDNPCARKQHTGFVPLIGGISVFTGIIFASIMFGWISSSVTPLMTYIFCISILVVLGAVDDAKDLSVKIRLVVQTLITFIMIFGSDLFIHNLGEMPFIGELNIGWVGYFLTVFAVIGAINAFNMVDGIDGLCGCLSIMTLLPMAIAFSWSGQTVPMLICLVICSAILPFLVVNLKLFFVKQKVFMGDAGSMMIGFSVVFLLLSGSQVDAQNISFSAAAALWFIAIPLMDMAAIMIRRIRKGQSPFQADRNHLHHIFLHSGFTSRQSLLIITIVQAGLSVVGLLGIHFSIPSYILMIGFVTIFFCYSYAIQHVWRVTKYLRARRINKVRLLKENHA